MTCEASPLTLTRVCKECLKSCEEALCCAASEMCLLTDKDLKDVANFEFPEIKDEKKYVGMPKALFSASGVANKCMEKYESMNGFTEECESRRLKAKAIRCSQSSAKPQKKRSKIEKFYIF